MKGWERQVRLGGCLLACAVAGMACAQAEIQPPLVFEVGFHQALRWSETTGRATYQVKVPVGRTGSRLQVTFRAGDGALTLHSATVGRLSSSGSLLEEPARITFAGQNGFAAWPHERKTSDAVEKAVAAGDELLISYDVEGALAASAIYQYPGSQRAGKAYARADGLDEIDVEGPSSRAFLVLGDSITEAYVDGSASKPDDIRNAWASVAQKLLGLPFANAGVSGQGVLDQMPYLSTEVFPVQHVTDCIVLLGTNDLGGKMTAPDIQSNLAQLFSQLQPYCRVWASTLLPKERTSVGDFATVVERRLEVNAWIRTQAAVTGVLDLEAVLRVSAADPNHFLPGTVADGIHPSIYGQLLLGQAVARYFMPPQVTGLAPSFGPPAGGTPVRLSGAGWNGDTAVFFDGLKAETRLSDDGALLATTPAHAEGTVDVRILGGNDAEVSLPRAFRFLPAGSSSSIDGVGGPRASCSLGLGDATPAFLLALIALAFRRKRIHQA